MSQPTDTYYSIHRAYMLTAGILGFWEILGISPQASKVNAQLESEFIKGVKITIESPEAAVWIIISLLVYFCVRFKLIWSQQPDAVKENIAVLRDYQLAHSLAALSFFAWSAQVVYPKLKLGEFLQSYNSSIVITFLIIVVIAYLANIWREINKMRVPQEGLITVTQRWYASRGKYAFKNLLISIMIITVVVLTFRFTYWLTLMVKNKLQFMQPLFDFLF